MVAEGSFLPTNIHNDPALNPANQYDHQHHHHSVEPVQEAHFSSAHGPREQPNMFAPGTGPRESFQPAAATSPNGDGKYMVEKDIRETGSTESPQHSHEEPHIKRRGWYSGFRVYWHMFYFAVLTAWWITGLILHGPAQTSRKRYGWVVPFLLWLFISLRLLTFHVSPAPIFRMIRKVWNVVFVGTLDKTVKPELRGYAGGILTVVVFLVGTMASKETPQNTRADRAISLFGLLVFIGIFYATSKHRRNINWKTVQVGLIAQFILALFVLRTGVGYDIFKFISDLARQLLGFASAGFAFLFTDASKFPYFVVAVLPAIIFFIALVQVAYYIGLLQWFIVKFASFFFWAMEVSGAEAVAAAAAPFIGQGENAILIRPFLNHLTKAEIHQIMTSGFATIAGSVFGAYVSLGANPQALLSSCIMSIPASIAMSKLRFPETEETLTKGSVTVPESAEERESNALEAFANGAALGLKVAGVISAVLLVVISAVALVDGLLYFFFKYFGAPQVTLNFILGYLFYPVAFLLGAPRDELRLIGAIIGKKFVVNEFAAFVDLTDPKGAYANLSNRGIIIATYAICGFGNIGSLGNQLGLLVLLAPKRAADITQVAVSALLTGVTATLMSASIAGMVLDRVLEVGTVAATTAA